MSMLIFDLEDGNQIEVPLEGRTMLGSAEGCDVLVEAEGIAAQHAEIYPAPEGGYWVRDLGSIEGTLINGKRITFQQLAVGDLLNFGPLSERFVAAPDEDEKPTDTEEVQPSPAVEESALKTQRESEERQHQEKLLSVQAEVGQHESHRAARRQEVAELDAQLEEKKNEQTRLNAALAELKKHEAEEAARQSQRESENREHQEKLASLRKESEEQEARIKSFAAVIADKKQEQELAEAALLAAHESARQLQSKEQIEDQHLQERIAAHKLELAQQEAKLAERREEAASLEARIEQKKYEHTSTETALQAVRDSLQGQKALLPEIEKVEQERFEKLSQAHGEAVAKHGILIKTLEALSAQERKRLEDLERLQQDTDALEARRDAARTGIQDDEAALATAKSIVQETEKNHGDLASAHQELESKHQALITQVSKITETLSGHGAEETRLRTAVEELEKARATAEAGLKERETKLQAQQATLAKATDALKQTEEKHSGLQTVHQELTVRHKDLGSQVAKFLELVSGHKSEEQRLRNLVADLTATQTRTESTLLEREAALAETEKKHGGLQSSQQKLQSQHQELTAQVAKLTETLNGHKTEEQRLRATLQELGKSRTTAEASLKECEGKLQEKSATLTTATEALKKAEVDHSAQVAAQQKLTAQQQELIAQIAQLAAAVATHKSDEARLRSTVQELEKARATAEATLKERETKLLAQHAALTTASETLQQTEASRTTAQKELEAFKIEHQKLVIDARRLEAANAGRKAEEERLRQEMKTVEARHAAADASMRERAAMLNERETAISKATEALKETREQHAMLIAEIEQFQGQVSRLTTEQQNLSQTRGRLTAENASLTSLEKSLRQSIAELESKKEEARKGHEDQKAKLNSITVSHADAKTNYAVLVKDLETLRGERKFTDRDGKLADEKHDAALGSGAGAF